MNKIALVLCVVAANACGPGAPARCDGDTVVDEDGNVVETCKAGSACGILESEPACEELNGLGENCNDEGSGVGCVEGLVCVYLGAEVGECFAPVGQGESCVLEDDVELPCEAGLACNLFLFGEGQPGQGQPGEGQCQPECERDEECLQLDSACMFIDCIGRCGPRAQEGAQCLESANAECPRVRRCVDGFVCEEDGLFDGTCVPDA